jgi:hypothetical protein
MAHRRTGLPSAPPPIDMEKELKRIRARTTTLADRRLAEVT